MRLNHVLSAYMGEVEILRRVKALVREIALDAIMAEANASAVVMMRPSMHFALEVAGSRLSAGWDRLSTATAQVRSVMGEPGSQMVSGALSDGQYALIAKIEDTDGPIAAVIVRDFAFSESERRALLRMLRSVLLALANHGLEEPLVVVDVTAHTHGYKAKVTVDLEGLSPVIAIKDDKAVAIATAATALAESPVTLRFAAQTSLEDGSVSIVLVEANDGGPIFGVSFDRAHSLTGLVAAVFRAARFVDAPIHQSQLVPV